MKNELTDGQIDALTIHHFGYMKGQPLHQRRAYARAIIEAERAQRQVEQEPVIVAFLHPDGTWHDASDAEHSAGMKPLYIAPQPATPPAVEPLTEAQITALAHRKSWRYKQSSDPHHSDTYTFNAATLRDFVHAIQGKTQ